MTRHVLTADNRQWVGSLVATSPVGCVVTIAQVDPRDPDHSREGIFVYHNCYRCDHGKKPCVQGGSHRCDNPRARND